MEEDYLNRRRREQGIQEPFPVRHTVLTTVIVRFFIEGFC
jgi:hypothetical protein